MARFKVVVDRDFVRRDGVDFGELAFLEVGVVVYVRFSVVEVEGFFVGVGVFGEVVVVAYGEFEFDEDAFGFISVYLVGAELVVLVVGYYVVYRVYVDGYVVYDVLYEVLLRGGR